MKILLIGGAGSLINRLIYRFKKEGDRVFLLTGSRYKDEKYESVFERYDFPYESSCIPEVFESVDPDVTICTGAFDTNYDWGRQEEKMSALYISDLLNLLLAFCTLRKGRFIYLSSQDVYSGYRKGTIPEEEEPDNRSFRGMALIQAEKLCKSYRENRMVDIVTLRMGNLYHCPENLQDIREIVSKMCLEALRDHRVGYTKNNAIAPLHEKDAVQFIYQVAFAKSCTYGLYNVAADLVTTEQALADLVARSFFQRLQAAAEDKSIKRYVKKQDGGIVDQVTGKTLQISVFDTEEEDRNRTILSNIRFRTEFGMNRYADLHEEIEEICGYMLVHSDVFLLDKEETFSGWQKFRKKFGWVLAAMIPFLENLVLFIPFFMLNNRAVGSQYFSKIDFYLLYVLLFAVVHGQQQAIVSAMLATAGYIFRQTYGRSGFDVVMDYNTYIWIAQLFIVGLVVGYMRDSIKKLREEAKEDHSYMAGQIQDMKSINNSNVRVKNALETQVISQHDSVGEIYQIVTDLDRYSADEVLFYAAEMLKDMMHTEDVAIYTSSDGPYARLFTATSRRAGSLGNSIRYEKLGELYQAVREHRVFINRALDKNLPMMACAIYRNDGKDQNDISTMVMIWSLSWERVTLSEADTLAVICALIQNAAFRASRYLEALEKSRFIENTRVLNRNAFKTLVRAHEEARRKRLTTATILRGRIGAGGLKELAEKTSVCVRSTDYMGILDDGFLYVLLTNTDEKGAAIVLQRMQEHGLHMSVTDFPDSTPEIQRKVAIAGGISEKAGAFGAGRSV
ncbi:MAG: NAD-dependent epimerase/dehydratase family protein [Bilifractor sp.]